MHWLFELNATHPVAHAVGILAAVCAAGMALGSVRIAGVRLGTAGVLFAGILTGHFGKPVNKATIDFVREFGLILFVFTMGLQLGPGFFGALRERGLRFNSLALFIVLLGAGAAPVVGWLANFDPVASVGIFSGASVNMPSLGAATQALSTIPEVSPERASLAVLSCAVSFPIGILVSIGCLVLLQAIFRINPPAEADEYEAKKRAATRLLERRTVQLTRSAWDGLCLSDLLRQTNAAVTVARVRHNGEVQPATDLTMVRNGDLLSVVGAHEDVVKFTEAVGEESTEDLMDSAADVNYRQILVTNGEILGQTVGEINLDDRFGVAVTRVIRSGIEMTAVPSLEIQFGDRVHLVGREPDLQQAERILGNSIQKLNETHFVPMFVGIVLGIALGTLPLAMPGLPQPLRLGLAGGPLIVALILSRIGHIGKLPCYMPLNANLAFREFGISLFFAAVGLDAGALFFQTIFSQAGVEWLLAGTVVTAAPLLIGGVLARVVFRMNYVELSGLLAGSTTNPPALAFATSAAGGDGPTLPYATVYPLTMLLRVLCAQLLTLLLVH